ncbi:MAG: hypothetical protein R3C45_20620 [Phycisphaerales bacterium]
MGQPQFQYPRFNDLGQTAFLGLLEGDTVDYTNDKGIWIEQSPGTLTLTAREGDTAPDTEPGVTFNAVGAPLLNNTGQIAFLATLTGTGITGTNNRGIWMGHPGTLQLTARTGDAAPGTEPGLVFSNLTYPSINDAGQVAFFANINGPGITNSNNSGIWTGPSAAPQLLIREGAAAPGNEPGVVFSGFGGPSLNRAGNVAFYGVVTGPGVFPTNNTGIWSQGGGTLEQIVREGDHAPGTNPGVTFATFDRPDTIVLNGAGQLAFLGWLTGIDVNTTNDQGIWATDIDGNLHLVLREGSLFDVSDDPLIEDLRTVSSMGMHVGTEDGRPVGFNNAGQIALLLTFTDGTSGVFVANIGLPATSTATASFCINDLNRSHNWNLTGPQPLTLKPTTTATTTSASKTSTPSPATGTQYTASPSGAGFRWPTSPNPQRLLPPSYTP